MLAYLLLFMASYILSCLDWNVINLILAISLRLEKYSPERVWLILAKEKYYLKMCK